MAGKPNALVAKPRTQAGLPALEYKLAKSVLEDRYQNIVGTK